jgi:hypothetical protein
MEDWEKEIRSEGCVCCGVKPVELHHLHTRKAHGGHAHIPENVLPVCRRHHREFHDRGISRVVADYGLADRLIKMGFEYLDYSSQWFLPKITRKYGTRYYESI